MSEFSKVVKLLTGDKPIDRLPCRWCGAPTLISMLTQYGARCLPCFEAYCAEGMAGMTKGFVDGRPDTPTQAEMRRRLK